MKRFMAALAGSVFFCLVVPVSGYAGLMSGEFDEGLSGWSVTGEVEAPEGGAILRTGGVRTGVYETSLSREGTFEGGEGVLTFRYGFETVGPDEILDPVYPSFFFDSFQVTVESGSRYEVVFLADEESGGLHPFSIDLGVSPGSPVRLTFSLLDEDDGRFSRAFLDDVRLGVAPVPEPETLILLGSGLLLLFAGGHIPPVFRRSWRTPWMPAIPIFVMTLVLSVLAPEVRGEVVLSNVDDQVRFAFSSAVFDSRTGNLTGKMTLTNNADLPLHAPLRVVIIGISDPSVTVANPTDFTLAGFPFLDLSHLLREGILQPGETTPVSDLSFHNPTRIRFRWDQEILAVPDPPPSGPVIFNLCLIPGENPPVCELLLEDFETADPEFSRIQTVPLPEMYARERVKVFVSDEVYPPESLDVDVDGRPAAMDADGVFIADLLLGEGTHEISVTASNPEGVAASRTLPITVDLSPPQIRILAPESGSRVVDTVPIVSGAVDDPGVREVILTYPGGSASVPVWDGGFSQAVALPLGVATITVEGTDQAGNRGIDYSELFRVNALEGNVTGRVFSEALGAPLAGAAVTAVPLGAESSAASAVVSGEDGAYALSGLPSGDVILTAWREGYERLEIRAFAGGGSEPLVQDFDLRLVRDGESLTLTGVVRDTGGIPIPGVRISVDTFLRSAETGPDGTYLLAGLPRDLFALRAGKPGYDPQEFSVSGGDYDPAVTLLVRSMTLRQSPDAILLQRPVSGETLGESAMIVGEFRRDFLDTAGEAAVRVNGLPAFLVGNRFMINRFPLVPGSNDLVVEVLGPDGVLAQEIFPVDAVSSAAPFFLVSSAESGIAPLKIFIHGVSELPFTLRAEGPAALEMTEEGDGYAVTFPSPGIYLLEGERVQAGEGGGDRIAVAVSDGGEAAAKLKKRWSAMIAALALGNIEGALGNLTAEAAYRYRESLEAMGEEGGRFFADLPGIELVEMRDGLARARLLKDDLSYPVWFARDLDGFYRIHRF